MIGDKSVYERYGDTCTPIIGRYPYNVRSYCVYAQGIIKLVSQAPIDLQATFDNVDREKLWEIMEEKIINADLIKKMRKIYKNTKVTIKIKGGLIKRFTVEKGIRQRCVMSLII